MFRPDVHLALRSTCLLVLFAVGCAQSSREKWVTRLGGVDQSDSLARLEAARDRLLLRDPLRSQITVAALRSDEPAAFSWDDGSIFATRGLLRLLDDDELAAALAHEVGHVLRNRGERQVLSLRGQTNAAGVEFEADAAGRSLIDEAGIPPASMMNMLLKVRNAATLSPYCRNEMTQRILRLSPPCTTVGKP